MMMMIYIYIYVVTNPPLSLSLSLSVCVCVCCVCVIISANNRFNCYICLNNNFHFSFSKWKLDIDSNRLEFAKKIGVQYVLSVRAGTPKELASQIEVILGQSPEISIECSGNPAGLKTSMLVRTVLVLFFLSQLYFYFSPCEFFTPVLIGSLSLESKWPQVSSGFSDSSRYSSWS